MYSRYRPHTIDGTNPAPVDIGSFSDYLQGLLHLRWLFGISPINSITSLHSETICFLPRSCIIGRHLLKGDFFPNFHSALETPEKPRWIKLRQDPRMSQLEISMQMWLAPQIFPPSYISTVSGFLNPCLLASSARFPTGHQPKHLWFLLRNKTGGTLSIYLTWLET